MCPYESLFISVTDSSQFTTSLYSGASSCRKSLTLIESAALLEMPVRNLSRRARDGRNSGTYAVKNVRAPTFPQSTWWTNQSNLRRTSSES